MASPAFGLPFSFWETFLRRCSGALSAYWRVARWLYSFLVLGVLVTALIGWILDWVGQHGKLPDPLRWPPLVAFARLPAATIALIMLGLVLILGSMVAAYFAHGNLAYYALLDASAANYRVSWRADRAAVAFQNDLAGSYSTGFEDRLWAERVDALTVYANFLSQHEKRILLIVGRGGSGKSTLLLRRMGELSGVLRPHVPLRPHPCVLINCEDDTLVDLERLLERIKEKLGKELRNILSEDVRGKHSRALVIFIDAINEGRMAASADINKLLTDFAQGYLDAERGFQVYLCMSVRTAYWEEQRRLHADNPMSAKFGWQYYVYYPERAATAPARSDKSTETASIVLGDFGPGEFSTAYAKYQAEYDITGAIEDPRTRGICGNPLMLEFFCRTFRGQDIRGLSMVRDLVRDIDLFNEYARTGLARIADKIGIHSAEPIINGESLAQRAIRGFLLELALEMVERGRAFLTDDEVFTVAQVRASEALEFGQRRIETVDGLYQDGSVLHALLSEGIVLERGRTVLTGRHEVSGLRFRYERYLEYSIGRGLVRRWRNERLRQEDIEKAFRFFMARHIELRARGFNNLREGLGMAILVAEQESGWAGSHIELLKILARDADFDWNQLACRMVQQLRPFNRSAPLAGEHQDKQRREVDELLAVLDELAKKNDFVLRWDIERALVHGVYAGEGQAVLRHLRRWLEPTAAFAQRLFASESLGYLFRQLPDHREEMGQILKQIVAAGSERDFWILRSLMFSIGAMIDTLEADATPDVTQRQLRADIEALPDDLLRVAQEWWDRSVILAAQVERGAASGDLARWLAWPWVDEGPWTLVNAALAAEQACARGECTPDIIRLLRRLWQARPGYSPNLSWAAWHVLGVAVKSAATDDRERAEASQLRAEIEDEARQRLGADVRAEWVLPAVTPAGRQLPVRIGTPVALVCHPEYGHTDLHNHPESKERVQSILEFLEASDGVAGLPSRNLLTYVSPGQLGQWSEDENEKLLELAHPTEWIRRVHELSTRLAGEAKPDIVLESDIEVRAGSYDGAVLAVRGAVLAMDLVTASPGVPLAVALVRPPGHLAGNKICIFNNVAVAARYGQGLLRARSGRAPRVLIVDIDAHHGKSTQDIFYQDSSVFYFSIHQEGVHPGTGKFAERGAGAGALHTVNVPIPAQSGDRVYSEVFRLVLRPILAGFEPELILVSLGLDAYCQDNFSQLSLTEHGYEELAAMLLDYRGRNPGPGLVACLEGGYDPHSMGRCVLRFMSAFTGRAAAAEPGPAPQPAVSWLDAYLLAVDQGTAEPADSQDHQRWIDDFEALVRNLHGQWAG